MNENRELDREIAENFFDLRTEYYGDHLVQLIKETPAPEDFRNYPWEYIIPFYSTDIGAAWLIIEKVRSMLFSRRQFFYKALQVELNKSLASDEKIHPTWQLQILEPRHICLAALRLMEWQKGIAYDE